MPIDANIFMQYAALRQRQNEDLGNKLGAIGEQANTERLWNKKLEAETAAKGLDLEKLATPALIKMQMGEELTPQDTAVLKAWDLTETRKLAPDASGNYRKVNASIFGGVPQGFDLGALGQTGGFVPPDVQESVEAKMPQEFAGGTSSPAMSDAQFDAIQVEPLPVFGGPLNTEMLQDALPVVPKQAGGFDTELVAPQQAPITVPDELKAYPNAANAYAVEAARSQATLPADIAKAGAVETAKKTAETAVNTEAKKRSLDSSIPLIEEIEKSIDETPSGYIENLGADATNLSGYSTKKSEAAGAMDPKIELLTNQLKNYIRAPGEGTWTDADQRKLDKLAPKPTDSTERKRAKLKSLREELLRAQGKKTPETRGFKYLGPE